MSPQLTDNFDILLKWGNHTNSGYRWADFTILRFEPCSVSEFVVHAEIHFTGVLNYQGPLKIQFETCIYAFEIAGFARRLRALAAGKVEEDLFVGAQDFSIHAKMAEGVPIAELRYSHFRCEPMLEMNPELRFHLGPFTDPIGTARIIEEVIQTLAMDCDHFPEHGPLKKLPPKPQIPPAGGTA